MCWMIALIEANGLKSIRSVPTGTPTPCCLRYIYLGISVLLLNPPAPNLYFHQFQWKSTQKVKYPIATPKKYHTFRIEPPKRPPKPTSKKEMISGVL